MTFVAFSEAHQIADRFIDLLARRGITPPVASSLEDELLSLTALIDTWKHPERGHRLANAAGIIRTAAGVHDFAAKVLCAQSTPEFNSLEDHLRLVATGKLKTTISQTTENDPADDTARKLAELYIACVAIHCGENVRIDHPVSSKGDNPDVLLSYNGQTWALAIKTPSSRHGETLFENIESAARQIERSKADKGLVVINAKNILDHRALWEPSQPFDDVDAAIAALKAQIAKVPEAADENRPAAEWDAIFGGRKAVLPVLFVGQSVVQLSVGALERVPTPVKMMLGCAFDRTPDPGGVELAECLTHWMQTLLRGEPGPPPR